MISLHNISFKNILTDICMTIRDGDYIGIAGPNGSGKSTLARIIKGIDVPTGGVVSINGKTRPSGDVTKEIGLVLANPENQLVSSSIEEDAAFGLENMKLPSSEIARRTEEALKWAGLWDIRDVPAHNLSAGQQQMLVLAGITAMKPRFLIMDEATSMIDKETRSVVLDTVTKMNIKEGVGIVHISHDLEELMGAGIICLMNKGEIAWKGSPKELHLQEPLLVEMGIDLPPLLKLKYLMIKEGLPVSGSALTEEEMADEIIKLFA